MPSRAPTSARWYRWRPRAHPGLIAAGEREGATLALDGRGVQVPGYAQGNFIGPTVFTDVGTEMSIYTNEIFARCCW